jgi:hypothetical protein
MVQEHSSTLGYQAEPCAFEQPLRWSIVNLDVRKEIGPRQPATESADGTLKEEPPNCPSVFGSNRYGHLCVGLVTVEADLPQWSCPISPDQQEARAVGQPVSQPALVLRVSNRLRVERRRASLWVVCPPPEQAGIGHGCTADSHAIEMVRHAFDSPAVDKTPSQIAHRLASRSIVCQLTDQTGERSDVAPFHGPGIHRRASRIKPTGDGVLVSCEPENHCWQTKGAALPRRRATRAYRNVGVHHQPGHGCVADCPMNMDP